MLLWKCAVCPSIISRFITEQEAFGIISYLAKILINISIIGPIFFKKRWKMIKIVKNVLLAGDKFMPKKTTWIYL